MFLALIKCAIWNWMNGEMVDMLTDRIMQMQVNTDRRSACSRVNHSACICIRIGIESKLCVNVLWGYLLFQCTYIKCNQLTRLGASGVRTFFLFPACECVCVFEFVYFLPNSIATIDEWSKLWLNICFSRPCGSLLLLLPLLFFQYAAVYSRNKFFTSISIDEWCIHIHLLIYIFFYIFAS